MKLIYNNVDLATFGTLRILEHRTLREPAEHPQRERVVFRVRLDLFEETFFDNQSLIEQMRSALKTQSAVLDWQDDNGTSYVKRTVMAGDDEGGEDALSRGGTFWQAITFTFWYFNHDVKTNSLGMTYLRSGTGGVTLDMGAVEKWSERLQENRWDEWRSGRKRVEGTITASGRYQGDTTKDLITRRNELLKKKDDMTAALLAAADGRVIFGTFNKIVRVSDFRAEVDQPSNYINWTISATYTAFPNESDYAWLELTLTTRENKREGIIYFTMAGRIGAPTAAVATARLASLRTALAPDNFVTLSEEVAEARNISESPAQVGSAGANTADGTTFIELRFTFEYRDSTGRTLTYQRSGENTPTLDLGTVDRFKQGYAVQLFDEMRNARRRAGGTVSLGGKWYAADSLSDAAKATALADRLVQFRAELLAGSSGRLLYGSGVLSAPDGAPIFNKVVRLVDFQPEIDRLRNCIEWTLTASYTDFPNESDYALCDLRVADSQDRTEGIVIKTLTGRIGAPTPEAARAKLARLRTALIPAGYVRKTERSEENRVEVESDLATGTNTGEATFIELTVNEEWQRHSGNVLSFKLRRTDEEDVRQTVIRTTFAGTVMASGTTQAAAFVTAEAMAAQLGAGKYPFLVRTSVVEVSNQVLTDGDVIVTVEFSYEYQRQGTKIYMEVTSELAEESFGTSVETVSGVIAAPSLALAQATYNTDARNLATYQGALLLNERRPMRSEQRVGDALTLFGSVNDRYSFSFQVLRTKASTQTAIQYSISVQSDVGAMEVRTTVRGTVWASTEAAANALVDTVMGGLSLGKRQQFTRTPQLRKGPQAGLAPGAQAVDIFERLEFDETWLNVLAGTTGLLETECSEELTYSGDRLVEKPIPDGPSIIQKAGTTCGRRVVTARATATTEAAAVAWVKGIRTALLTGTPGSSQKYEAAPQITTSFRFLTQTAGIPRGAGANVRVSEAYGSFNELLPEIAYT